MNEIRLFPFCFFRFGLPLPLPLPFDLSLAWRSAATFSFHAWSQARKRCTASLFPITSCAAPGKLGQYIQPIQKIGRMKQVKVWMSHLSGARAVPLAPQCTGIRLALGSAPLVVPVNHRRVRCQSQFQY